MHLILSSCDFGNVKSRECILSNLKKHISQCKVLFFPNEKATRDMILSEKYYHWMTTRGFLRENTYIFDYWNPGSFAELPIDCIHISGGNTFQMLERIRNCHADALITNYAERGVTYIGGSAGAHLVTKDIRHVLAFEPAPANFSDYRGLGLFDGTLFCHFSDARNPFYEAAIAGGRQNVYPLTDEESLVIANSQFLRYPVNSL